MYIEIISEEKFTNFASKHYLKNLFQTSNYANSMKPKFQVMYIGAYRNKELVAASLILYKEISSKIKYGYAPRGFLIDFYDTDLLKEFTKSIKGFFLSRGFAFIKINPEITYATIDYLNQSKQVNSKAEDLINNLKSLGYKKLKNTLYYSYMLPKYTPIIYLNDYTKVENDENFITKNGLKIDLGTINDIDTFYNLLDNHDKQDINFYKSLYNEFSKTNSVDLLLIELNYATYIKYLQKMYNEETIKNEQINENFKNNINNIEIYNQKMKSDKALNDISYSITLSNKNLKFNTEEIVGSALVIKQNERATLLAFGTKDFEKDIYIKTFIINSLIDKYKKEKYIFLDLYEIVGKLNDENIYSKEPDFKLEYKPTVYEYIGEFDLSISKTLHKLLLTTNKLDKEFSKKIN